MYVCMYVCIHKIDFTKPLKSINTMKSHKISTCIIFYFHTALKCILMKRYKNHEPENAVHNLPDYNIDIVAHRSITDSSFVIMSSMVSFFSITIFSNLLRIK